MARMTRKSLRDRGSADVRGARRAVTRDIPYDMQLARGGSVVLAVCPATGDNDVINNEDAPTRCPLCSADGTKDGVDTCTDAHDARGDSQDTGDRDDRQDGQEGEPTQAALTGYTEAGN